MVCSTPSEDPGAEEITEALTINYLRVQSLNTSYRFWNRYLSRDQQWRLKEEVDEELENANRKPAADTPPAPSERSSTADFEIVYQNGGTVGMWMRLHGVTEQRAVIDLAKLLNFIDEGTQNWLLRATGEESDDPEEALEMSLERADLVLTEEPRAVYWMGKLVDVDWDRFDKMWTYFLIVCEHAKEGQPVDAASFGERHRPDNHIKRLSRLTTKITGFPYDLGALIQTADGGRQQLNVPPQRIRILRARSAAIRC